jgi:hypothetical protein
MDEADDLELIRGLMRAHGATVEAEYHRSLEKRLEPARHGLEGDLVEPRVGAGPFEPSMVYGKGTIDTDALSPRAYFRGPDDMDIDITYVSPGIPATVQRHDSAVLIADTTINWITPGVFVGSVVIIREGKTTTLTPTYTGFDITHIDRVVV